MNGQIGSIQKFNANNQMLITHGADMDGAVCAVLFAKCFPGSDIWLTDTGEASNNAILDVIHKVPQHVNLYICDVSMSTTTAEILNARGNVNYIDHHGTMLWADQKYAWALVDTKYSACRHLYYLLSQDYELRDYEQLALLGDDHDRWQHNIPGSEELAKLLTFTGIDAWISRFINNSKPELTECETYAMKYVNINIQIYIQDVLQRCHKMTMDICNNCQFVICSQHISQVGQTILTTTGCHIAVMYNPEYDTVHLRGDSYVDLGNLAAEYGGGGHKNAAGFSGMQLAKFMSEHNVVKDEAEA